MKFLSVKFEEINNYSEWLLLKFIGLLPKVGYYYLFGLNLVEAS